MCKVKRLACGLSTATNSTPESIRVAMRAKLRDSRSSLAITKRAFRFRQRAKACLSCGRSLRFPVSISVNSEIGAKSRPTPSNAPREPADRPRRHVVHSSLYLPEPVYEALRETAFHERRKIHDLIIEGIDAVLKKRKYPSVADLKAGMSR
jgi:hypothetical protein